MDLEPDGAWQVDAAKLGASADIFFTVAPEVPIIVRHKTDMPRSLAALQNWRNDGRLDCPYSTCWPFSPSRPAPQHTCEAPVKTKYGYLYHPRHTRVVPRSSRTASSLSILSILHFQPRLTWSAAPGKGPTSTTLVLMTSPAVGARGREK